MHDLTTPTGQPDRVPATCPYGHALTGPPVPEEGGRVLVGWLPCHCVDDTNDRGHRTYTCRKCQQLPDRREVICFFPPHQSS